MFKSYKFTNFIELFNNFVCIKGFNMKYYLISGEASGDLHGSNLIRGLKSRDPQAEFRFWGGDMMASASGSGEALVRHYNEGAVMGVSDVIAKAGKLLGNVKFCKQDILSWKPDVVILIDYPGFNFKIAEFAHKKGFKVFYYIAPKTWASRESRNRKLKKFVDSLFIIFPFEKEYFNAHGVKYEYCGNPLIDAIDGSPALSEARDCFLSRNDLADKRYIALLAGSRKGEIKRMMPVYMQFADRLRKYDGLNDMEFIIAGAPSRNAADYEGYIGGRPYVHLVFNETYSVLKNAEAAVINSGTASLEAALIGTPQVVGWTSTKLTAFVARKILKVQNHIKFISLGNLIVDRLVFKEFYMEDFTVENITDEILHILNDNSYRAGMIEGYNEIRSRLGSSGASGKIAEKMIGLISSRN